MATGKLAFHVHVQDENGDVKVFGPDDTVPAWAAKKITNSSAWASSDAQAEGAVEGSEDPEDSGPKPYSEWLKADLEAEVASRNEGRDEDDAIEVEGSGNKPDLIAALEADDAANSGA